MDKVEGSVVGSELVALYGGLDPDASALVALVDQS